MADSSDKGAGELTRPAESVGSNPTATDSAPNAALILQEMPSLRSHPQAEFLIRIVSGATNISSAGFPYISDRSFRLFIEHVPHLFKKGGAVLSWLDLLERELGTLKTFEKQELDSIARAIKVLRTIVYTAGVTSPPDLWLIRQILSTHKEIGTLDRLSAGHAIDIEEYADERGLNLRQLRTDIHFLYSRGLLRRGDSNYIISKNPAVALVLQKISIIDPKYRINLVPMLIAWFSEQKKTSKDSAFLVEWLRFDVPDIVTNTWVANLFQIDLGYRILPLILSLRVLGLTDGMKLGTRVGDLVPDLLPEMEWIFELAGFTKAGKVSALGARVFARGPGPFGIIHAYHPYLNHLDALLKNEEIGSWVHRGENVTASQDANRKTFEKANDQLDAFCQAYDFKYSVFIEHAVGQGEAIRQRLERSGKKEIRYFGADLEDAAIVQAIELQKQGHLPENMEFIRKADIGEPEVVINYIRDKGLLGQPTVMMVGNGFHEIREQTNKKMIEVFKAYRQAGFVLIFTEESALHDEALLHTAWNTYHAGFRYVHEVSGQGLRPAHGGGDRWSWRKCASLGGYHILNKYSYRSRTIYPHKRPQHKNPSISETYFCIPSKLKDELKTD